MSGMPVKAQLGSTSKAQIGLRRLRAVLTTEGDWTRVRSSELESLSRVEVVAARDSGAVPHCSCCSMISKRCPELELLSRNRGARGMSASARDGVWPATSMFGKSAKGAPMHSFAEPAQNMSLQGNVAQ